jgi:predicted RNA-binding Zn-ribbon protein involved in translation (DUF1610 family)
MKRNLSQLYDPTKYFQFECPKCGSAIPYLDVKIGFGLRYVTQPFECSACESLLCVSRIYLWFVFLGIVGVSLAITAALRVRPWWLFGVVALVASQVIAMLAGAYVKWLFPPKIHFYISDDLSFTARR